MLTELTDVCGKMERVHRRALWLTNKQKAGEYVESTSDYTFGHARYVDCAELDISSSINKSKGIFGFRRGCGTLQHFGLYVKGL